MTVVTTHLAFIWPVVCVDELNVTGEHVEQFALAGGFEVGDRAFDQMAGVVEFVAVAQVGQAVLRFDGGVEDVQVAVGLLGLFDQVDESVDLRFECRIGGGRQAVGGGFDPLSGVGVPENVRLRLALLPVKTPCVDAAGVLHLPVNSRDCPAAVGLLAFAPEAACQCDLTPGHGCRTLNVANQSKSSNGKPTNAV